MFFLHMTQYMLFSHNMCYDAKGSIEMEWFDDEVFAEFCRKRDLVLEKYLSFYIRWIKRFIQRDGK